jgi:hypothetical protein
MFGPLQRIVPAMSDINIEVHAREIYLEHVGNIDIVFNDQKTGFTHRAS